LEKELIFEGLAVRVKERPSAGGVIEDVKRPHAGDQRLIERETGNQIVVVVSRDSHETHAAGSKLLECTEDVPAAKGDVLDSSAGGTCRRDLARAASVCAQGDVEHDPDPAIEIGDTRAADEAERIGQ